MHHHPRASLFQMILYLIPTSLHSHAQAILLLEYIQRTWCSLSKAYPKRSIIQTYYLGWWWSPISTSLQCHSDKQKTIPAPSNNTETGYIGSQQDKLGMEKYHTSCWSNRCHGAVILCWYLGACSQSGTWLAIHEEVLFNHDCKHFEASIHSFPWFSLYITLTNVFSSVYTAASELSSLVARSIP